MQLSDLRGIGKTRLEALHAAGICSLRDLLYAPPVRYRDLSSPVSVARARAGEAACLLLSRRGEAKLSRHGKLSRVTCVFADETGEICACWFNQPWMREQINAGTRFTLFGTVEAGGARKRLSNPSVEKELRIVPVYRVIPGLPQRLHETAVRQALEAVEEICPETLPGSLLERYGLWPCPRAMRALHAPASMEEAEKARRRFAFEEMLLYQASVRLMRDARGNCVVVCSIENLDPMGIHTGDSITVAPALTLTDREYQRMRDAALAVMREIGVDTGGSNVQFALNPENGRMIVIEMNPRVSRSSALASKATGFPIAKIAAKLAVGFTLDELLNDITRSTPACFEPSIDYVVTKIPRFAFEKFPGADPTLGTQMKSVGETMAIGRTFKESFQKGLRSLEIGRDGFGADGKDAGTEALGDAALKRALRFAAPNRIFAVRAAFARGWSVDEVHEICGIDRWFLRELEELTAFADEIKSAGTLAGLEADPALFLQAKSFGFSDRQIAHLLGASEADVFAARERVGLAPRYNLVDTCAAEFKAFTPYFYSTYDGAGLAAGTSPQEARDAVPAGTKKKKIMILGGGPNRIGQGIEFDYCCCHASFALRAAGFETVMVNSNPETVSTDYDTSDKLYFEPLTLEDVLPIYRREKCDGVIVQFGGQTPLNLADGLKANGANVIGTAPEMIDAAEDRRLFAAVAEKAGILQPPGATATTVDGAAAVAAEIGYPVLMRPSFVLGGRAMVIVHDEAALRAYMKNAVEVSESRPVLIDRYLGNATEVDVDCISDGETTVVGGIMEHVEYAGIHSGDSACMIPAPTLSEAVKAKIRADALGLASALRVRGLMNIQFAVRDGEVFVLEANPRA